MVGLTALVAIALAVPMAVVVAASQRAGFVSGLEVDTLSSALLLSSSPTSTWQATADATAARTGARVVVVSPDRSLLVDS